jgi:cardiolipin synthase
MTVDGRVTLIGSANMDRRSFDLNYENNILLVDELLTRSMIDRQQTYLAHSYRVSREVVEAWPMWRRLWNNLIATLGPLI